MNIKIPMTLVELRTFACPPEANEQDWYKIGIRYVRAIAIFRDSLLQREFSVDVSDKEHEFLMDRVGEKFTIEIVYTPVRLDNEK